MWYSMSKSSSSTQYGWSSPSGTSSSRRRSTGTSGRRWRENVGEPREVERLRGVGRVKDADSADMPGRHGRLEREERGVEPG